MSSNNTGAKLLTSLENYTEEERKKLLGFINSASAKDLTQNLSESVAASIVAKREKVGLFSEFDSVVHMRGVTEYQFKKLLHNVVGCRPSSGKTVCIPKISQERKKSVETIIALNMNLRNLIWIHMSRDLHVLEWNEIVVCEDGKNYSPTELFELVNQRLSQLPNADVYVMEQLRLPNRTKNVNIPYMVSSAALQSSLIAILNYDYVLTKEHRVFTMKPHVTTSHFNIGIKNERISCLGLLEKLIDKKHAGQSTVDKGMPHSSVPKICDKLFIPTQFIQSFSKGKSSVKEELGITLLLALTFYDLVIFK